MILGKVIGNVVSTIMAPGYESRKLFIIQPVDPAGKPKVNPHFLPWMLFRPGLATW